MLSRGFDVVFVFLSVAPFVTNRDVPAVYNTSEVMYGFRASFMTVVTVYNTNGLCVLRFVL